MSRNKVDAKSISEFSKQFVSTWLDDEYLPSVQKIREKDWKVVPVADFINAMEAEWLSDAIVKADFEEVIGLCFMFNGDPVADVVDVSRDSLLKYNASNSHQYVCLTSLKSDFLYFKDHANRFFLLCGSNDFLKNSYKCSLETAKLMYFDYWVDDAFHTKEEKQFLIKIWEKYSII
jgi:hypothetical protein